MEGRGSWRRGVVVLESLHDMSLAGLRPPLRLYLRTSACLSVCISILCAAQRCTGHTVWRFKN